MPKKKQTVEPDLKRELRKIERQLKQNINIFPIHDIPKRNKKAEAQLKKELRKIDRQIKRVFRKAKKLSRFGVLIDGYKQNINIDNSIVPSDIVPNIVSYLKKKKIKNFESVNKSTVSYRRHNQCKKMRERLKSNDQYSNAQRFNANEPILRSSENTYVKCHPDNIYGEVKQETAPYLWPLLSSEPENYRYISPAEFLQKAERGTLTLDEIFMFNMVHDINTTNDFGRTALMFSCEIGDMETATMLLNRGAEIDQVDKNDQTALMMACESGHYDIVDMLLEREPELDQKDIEGKTALIIAFEEGHMDIVELLIYFGADVEMNLDYVRGHYEEQIDDQRIQELITLLEISNL